MKLWLRVGPSLRAAWPNTRSNSLAMSFIYSVPQRIVRCKIRVAFQGGPWAFDGLSNNNAAVSNIERQSNEIGNSRHDTHSRILTGVIVFPFVPVSIRSPVS